MFLGGGGGRIYSYSHTPIRKLFDIVTTPPTIRLSAVPTPSTRRFSRVGPKGRRSGGTAPKTNEASSASTSSCRRRRAFLPRRRRGGGWAAAATAGGVGFGGASRPDIILYVCGRGGVDPPVSPSVHQSIPHPTDPPTTNIPTRTHLLPPVRSDGARPPPPPTAPPHPLPPPSERPADRCDTPANLTPVSQPLPRCHRPLWVRTAPPPALAREGCHSPLQGR